MQVSKLIASTALIAASIVIAAPQAQASSQYPIRCSNPRDLLCNNRVYDRATGYGDSHKYCQAQYGDKFRVDNFINGSGWTCRKKNWLGF